MSHLRSILLVSAIRILAVALVLVVVAGVALYATHERRYNLSESVSAARHIWGDACGEQNPNIVIRDLPGDQAGKATVAWVQLAGVRRYTQCEIAVDSRYADHRYGPKYCGIVVHEWGHLVGKGHSNDPDSVMYPKITARNIPERCK